MSTMTTGRARAGAARQAVFGAILAVAGVVALLVVNGLVHLLRG